MLFCSLHSNKMKLQGQHQGITKAGTSHQPSPPMCCPTEQQDGLEWCLFHRSQQDEAWLGWDENGWEKDGLLDNNRWILMGTTWLVFVWQHGPQPPANLDVLGSAQLGDTHFGTKGDCRVAGLSSSQKWASFWDSQGKSAKKPWVFGVCNVFQRIIVVSELLPKKPEGTHPTNWY